MNKHQKEVIQHQITMENLVLDLLEKQYKEALKDINLKIKILMSDPLTQSRIYRIEYQKTLKKQIEAALEKLHSDEYSTIQQYLSDSYTDGFVGTMYDIHGQGVPVITPIDQNAAIKAVMTDTKLKKKLYDELGFDVNKLKKTISEEISRGIASSLMYSEIARNIQFHTDIPLRRAKTIARTEGHRIQQASAEDARQKAKAKGADVVKQWDAMLDGKTRKNHRQLDGQIREVNEPFTLGTKKAMYPGEFGIAAEDCNCRCVATTRARWALDEDELKTLRERAVRHSLYLDDPKAFRADKLPKLKNYEEFKKNYLKAAETIENTGENRYNKGAISGAYNDSNDPDWEKRNAHADQYYTALRNSKKSNVVEAIAKNAGVKEVLVSRMYDHLLVNEYDLDGEIKRFDTSYDIAQSLQRLREGKNIQEHDRILILHESTEYLLMNRDGLSYEDAHQKANEKYDYATALKKFLKQKDGE